MPPLLLTPADAATALGVGRTTMAELIRSGALPSVRIGAARRIRTADMTAYVAGLA